MKNITAKQALKQIAKMLETLEAITETEWYPELTEAQPIECALDTLRDACEEIEYSLECKEEGEEG
ncbi:MAG: hypothetical protein WCP55_16535 [Lentisphaerota bacterium]